MRLIQFDARKFCYQIYLFLDIAVFPTWFSSVRCSCVLVSQGLIADPMLVHVAPAYDPEGERLSWTTEESF